MSLIAIVEYDGQDFPIYEPDDVLVSAAEMVFQSVKETFREMVRCGEVLPPHLRGEIFHGAMVDAIHRMCPNLPDQMLRGRTIGELEALAETIRKGSKPSSHRAS